MRVPVLRIESRVPPPPNFPPRSGTFILDLHEFRVDHGCADEHVSQRRHTSFSAFSALSAGQRSRAQSTTMATIEIRRAVVAYSLVNASKASAVLSIGSISDNALGKPENLAHTSEVPLLPRLTVQSDAPTNDPSISSQSSATTLTVNIPSVYACLSKPYFDGLQLWADDATQLLERLAAEGKETDSYSFNRTPSMIGSRFFARRSGSGSSDTSAAFTASSRNPAKGELNVKLTVSEREFNTFDISRSATLTYIGSCRPFDAINERI